MHSLWGKLAGNYATDPKVLDISPLAELLYVRLLAYTIDHRTDGKVSGNALALCCRKLRNRDKLVAELLDSELLLQDTSSGASSEALVFPPSWHQWQSRQHTSEHKIAGQGGSLAGDREEKRREERSSKDLDLKVINNQAQARETEDSDSAKWSAIMSDLASHKPVLIDGQLCTRVNGQWEPINGTAR